MKLVACTSSILSKGKSNFREIERGGTVVFCTSPFSKKFGQQEMQTNIVRTNIRIISFHKGVERLKEEAGVYPCCGSRRSEILMK